MKKFIYIIPIVCLLFSCQEHSNMSISGKISNSNGGKFYLNKLLVNGEKKLDSININSDGTFEFKSSTSNPSFYILKKDSKNFITLLVDSNEHVKIFADYNNLQNSYKIKGSESSKLVQELSNHLIETKTSLDSIKLAIRESLKEEKVDETEKLKIDFNKKVSNQVAYSQQFVKQHPFNMASILALYQKFDNNNFVVNDLQTMKIAASALIAIYPESEHVKALHSNTLSLMRRESNIKLNTYLDKVSINSPDVSLPNPNGDTISLSSLNGKYVLLQFWSSKDKASRILNNTLVENYKVFKNKKFEIYQITVDENKSDWVNAIKEDNLTWINVGDMKGSNTALNNYNIRTIPFNYLLDPEGNILAKNLKGPQIQKVLNHFIK